jgi:hypothetical protein
MDEQRKKTLMYAAAGGGGLGLLYMVMRPKGSAAPTASSSGTELESLYRSVTESFTTQIGEQQGIIDALAKALRGESDVLAATLRGESKTEIERVEAEQAAARTAFAGEQKGLFDTFTAGINTALAGTQKTVAQILRRLTHLETAAERLTKENTQQGRELEKQAKQIAGQQESFLEKLTKAVGKETEERKKQAQLVGDTSRIAAARASGLSNLLRWGTSQSQSEVDRTVKAITAAYDLTESETEAVRTWLQQQSNRLARGEFGGAGGLGFLSPIIPGPMGASIGQTIAGSIPVHSPRLDASLATPTWGFRQ